MNLVALQGIRGGVGTTSIVAGLALAAREQGARVLAVDLCQDNLLGIHLGLPHDDPRGWSRLADPAGEWASALYRYEEGLDLLPHGGAAGVSAGPWLAAITGYDLVLLDVPMTGLPGLPCRRLLVVNADANCHVRLYRHRWEADERLLVTQFTSRRALQQDLLDLWQAGGRAAPAQPASAPGRGDGRSHGRQATGRAPCPRQPDRPRADDAGQLVPGRRG